MVGHYRGIFRSSLFVESAKSARPWPPPDRHREVPGPAHYANKPSRARAVSLCREQQAATIFIAYATAYGRKQTRTKWAKGGGGG